MSYGRNFIVIAGSNIHHIIYNDVIDGCSGGTISAFEYFLLIHGHSMPLQIHEGFFRTIVHCKMVLRICNKALPAVRDDK